MADFNLDRIRFNWNGSWTASKLYTKDDVVYYNGKAFVCLQGHTANQNFYADKDGTGTLQYTVTVGIDTLTGKTSGNFYLNGIETPEINLITGKTYIIDQSDATNTSYSAASPMAFSAREDGALTGANRTDIGITYLINDIVVSYAEYVAQFSTGVTRIIRITLPSNSPDKLYYYGSSLNMGSVINTKYNSFWELMFDGKPFDGVWTTNRVYSEGSIVIYGSAVYFCSTTHTSAASNSLGLEASLSNWTLISSVDRWTSVWQIDTRYIKNDLVKYGAVIYRCTSSHTSATTVTLGLESDISNWQIVSIGINYKGNWQKQHRYKTGDIVKKGPSLWKAVTGHTSTPTIYNIKKTSDNTIIAPTITNDALADSVTTIVNGSLLGDSALQTLLLANVDTGAPTSTEDSYGLSYIDVDRNSVVASTDSNEIELFNSTGNASSSAVTTFIRDTLLSYLSSNGYTIDVSGIFLQDIANWELYVPGLALDEVWNSVSDYQIGDIVLHGGYSYIALQTNINSLPSVNKKSQNTGDWELLIAGYKMQGTWDISTGYKTGDIVRNGGYLYIALDDTTAIYPDSDIAKWQKIIEGIQFNGNWQDNTVYFLGDIVTFIDTSYICIQRHNSSASEGRPDLDLSQPDQDYWEVVIQGAESNVLQDDGDLKVRGDSNVDERFAIGAKEYQLTSSSNNLHWKSLVSMPRAFYVSNSGLDSTEYGVSDNKPFKTIKYACDYVRTNITGTLSTSAVNSDYILQIALNTIFTAGNTSTFPNLAALLTSTNSATGRLYGDVDSSSAGIAAQDVTSIQNYFNGTLTDVKTKNAIDSIIKFISYNSQLYTTEFISVSSVDYPILNSVPPNTTIFIKTGFYEEQLPISIPANCAVVGDEQRSTSIKPAQGYELSNMFYVRNGSGLRNVTLSGLSGTLGAPNANLTRRPTAGAFVSLDPGTGPADSTVWIATRSPYVQGVSALGTGCVGMKIDGALHSSGNRSIVANDFTQVLSDGIAYWATNLGRSELVSVFTYYCHIGYLAEAGGILRATNGNNSYGEYGSVAEGFDTTETVITGQINNRSSNAKFKEAITYGTNEQSFLAIGYSHAGQDYTSADITFGGSGLNAAGSYTEFRKNAISNFRILDIGDSSPIGGLNYTRIVNSLQEGNDGLIKLSQAETATAAELIGQRLVIISGVGVGQYGEISSFDESTKDCIISKESNGQLGFDHFQPGWPTEQVLDQTSKYSIEPRIIVSEPLLTTSISPATTSNNWKYIAFGGNRFVAVNNGGAAISAVSSYSTSTTSWNSEVLIDTNTTVSGIVYTGSKFLVANESVNGAATNQVSQSADGATTWANITLPSTVNWGSIASNNLGNAVIIATGGNQTVAYSGNHGDSWTAASIGGTTEDWGLAAYGNGTFVTLSNNSSGDIAYSTDNGANWTIVSAAVNNLNWTGVTYGNGRFVAVGLSYTAYSFDGITWYESEIEQGTFTNVSYGAGVFIATGTGSLIARSADGKVWKTFSDDSTSFTTTASGTWEQSVYNNNGSWVAVQNGSTTWNTIVTGATPIIRALVESSKITGLTIYDPGSNLPSSPVIEIFDNSVTAPVQFETFINNGVLAQPEMSNRGSGYFTSTASITGNGFAELYQTGTTLVLKTITSIPGPGANLSINGIDTEFNISRVDSQSGTGPFDITVTVRPGLLIDNSPVHETSVILREQYSQIRLTGHDFLDIGTGNFDSTRYPTLYLEGEDSLNASKPFNETVEFNAGRVFYTSTDQDGNFRTGELFSVEQSTGIVTVDATQFNLSGLEELSLGGIQLGGTLVVVREFSKEQTFIANSNNIVPTMRAVRAYVQSRISGGGSAATTNVLSAGQIDVRNNKLSTSSNLQINVNTKMNITGGISGDFLASQYFVTGGK